MTVAAIPGERRCCVCRESKPVREYDHPKSRRCVSCGERKAEEAAARPRTCLCCGESKRGDEFPSTRARKCSSCQAADPTRPCGGCGRETPGSDFVPRGTRCSSCRATPSPSRRAGWDRCCIRCHAVKAPECFSKRPSGRRSTVCDGCWEAEAERKRAAARQRSAAVREVDGVRMRTCTVCREEKPEAEEFYVNKRWPDGSPRARHSHCRTCSMARIEAHKKKQMQDPYLARRERDKNNARTRRWREENPDTYREASRRSRAKRRADPDKHQRDLENNRISYALRRERAGLPLRDPGKGLRNKRIWLPAAPLAARVDGWLERQQGKSEPFETRRVAAGREELCASLGVSIKTVGDWARGEREHVNIDTADAILTSLGLNWHDVWSEEELECLAA